MLRDFEFYVDNGVSIDNRTSKGEVLAKKLNMLQEKFGEIEVIHTSFEKEYLNSSYHILSIVFRPMRRARRRES